jgi:hypothetical protein
MQRLRGGLLAGVLSLLQPRLYLWEVVRLHEMPQTIFLQSVGILGTDLNVVGAKLVREL